MNPFAGDIPYVESPIAKINYFTHYGRVRIIDGLKWPCSSLSCHDNWFIFNFGRANDGDIHSFEGVESLNKYMGPAVFGFGDFMDGMERTRYVPQDAEVDTGAIWGFTKQTGWNLLYLLDLTSNGAVNQRNGDWFSESFSTETNQSTFEEIGKREAYDNMLIEYVGFSVHNRRSSSKIQQGLTPVVTSRAMVCCDNVTKHLGRVFCVGSQTPTMTPSPAAPASSPTAFALNISDVLAKCTTQR